MATYKLDSFGPEFWTVEDACVKHPGGRPISIEQALWEISPDGWFNMAKELFPNYALVDVSVNDVITLIRETNTCSNLNPPVEVWIDEDGDFTIKVYDK